jgi:hypothetical protein
MGEVWDGTQTARPEADAPRCGQRIFQQKNTCDPHTRLIENFVLKDPIVLKYEHLEEFRDGASEGE